MEARIYDRYLNFKGVIENHTSLIWCRKYYEPGNFEIHAPITDRNLQLLSKGNVISKRGSDEAGIIESIENEESDIRNEITAKGRFLSAYMDRRLIKSTVNFSGYVEIAMRQLLTGAEPVPLVELGELNGFTEKVEFQATMKNLMSYETKLAKSAALGYRLRPDFKEKVMYFETYKGMDRTTGQGVNSRVVFSESYNNLNNVIYKYNDQQYRTKAIVGGEGEGAARVYVEVGSGSGFDLREIFVDAKDIQSEGMTAAAYKAALTQRGLETLANNITAESVECETEADINFKYKTHYDLGDIVTVKKKKWGITLNQRITELQEVYEYGGMYVVPTMGDALPEKIDWSDK